MRLFNHADASKWGAYGLLNFVVYTIINGAAAQKDNVNAANEDVAAISAAAYTLDSTELAALLDNDPSIAVADAGAISTATELASIGLAAFTIEPSAAGTDAIASSAIKVIASKLHTAAAANDANAASAMKAIGAKLHTAAAANDANLADVMLAASAKLHTAAAGNDGDLVTVAQNAINKVAAASADRDAALLEIANDAFALMSGESDQQSSVFTILDSQTTRLDLSTAALRDAIRRRRSLQDMEALFDAVFVSPEAI